MKTEPKINLTAEEYLAEETKKSVEEFVSKLYSIFSDYEDKLNKKRESRYLPEVLENVKKMLK